ncbi:low temperature requirement protein A [Pseudonocardia cypriaca]|uniref:Low temperature requirement protein LtrA n=1 Tax=Pseudonocardia cypriaca TaxID=882449 RepID=A0A543FSW4_9PSEU|nr:low temperature requirement protein A [Pseudonocardia cypriaca]TQM36937.1 low temperature requirement protein LtrA [Pseudonocardia cypriaca]
MPQLRIPMTARSVDEPHRAATQLELLFDLTFVVAVAAVVAQLGHAVADGHAAQAVSPFLQVFFAIWWAWMNFTWFASSYDTDDVPYRLLTLLQMGGVLVLAAGVPAAFAAADYRAITLGYLVMRVGLFVLWLRAAREHPEGRRTALRYAAGIGIAEVLWLVRLLLAELGVLTGVVLVVAFVALAGVELAVPMWAERSRGTSWHPRHIAERYALFTIILLGESVLAASIGIADVVSEGLHWSLVVVAGSGLVLLFALWWLYELEPSGDGLSNRRSRSFLWGYGHYGIFASLAALGAGLEVAVRQTGAHGALDPRGAGYAVAIPTALFLALLWASHSPIVPRSRVRPSVLFGAAALVLLAPAVGAGAGVGAVVALVALAAAAAVLVTILRTTAPESAHPLTTVRSAR